uniref:Uncharacterized protein n=1 Tax=Panagrolaimus davidi TaxID=227884 RepID=A0A914QSC1_9BILA
MSLLEQVKSETKKLLNVITKCKILEINTELSTSPSVQHIVPATPTTSVTNNENPNTQKRTNAPEIISQTTSNGTVKFFCIKKQYGFITCEDGTDVFVKTLLKHSCYKLMLYLAILDLNTSIYVGFWAGFINVTGIHFCASRTLIFWIGCLNSVAWRTQSTATCLLAFNRCIDAYNKQWGKFLFHGYKTYFWMTLPILYGGSYMIIGCPGIFSPIYSSILYNPHAGYAEDYNNSTFFVKNIWVYYHNFFNGLKV